MDNQFGTKMDDVVAGLMSPLMTKEFKKLMMPEFSSRI